MARDDDEPRARRPDLRAPEGGLDLHLDRLTFLRKVRELHPEVLRDLHDRATSDQEEDEALREWSSAWNLADPWLLDAARNTYRIFSQPDLHRQRRQGYVRAYELNRELIERGEVEMRPPPFGPDEVEPLDRHLRWYVSTSLPDLRLESVRDFPLLRTPAPPFEFADYDPEVDAEADADARMWARWQAYKAKRRYEAREDGATKAPKKRARSGEDATLHFEWLARWQVGKETYEEIARDPGEGVDPVRPKTVGVAVRSTADRIGLTRRTAFSD